MKLQNVRLQLEIDELGEERREESTSDAGQLAWKFRFRRDKLMMDLEYVSPQREVWRYPGGYVHLDVWIDKSR